MHAILPNGFPKPTDNRIAIRVTPNAERSIREGHPWLFEHSIRRQSAEGQPGDLGVLFDRKERFLAVGLYDPNSPIRVRILQHGKSVRIDAGWFRKQIAAALQVRNLLDGTQTTGYRLVHGENDGLPGLVIDRYADTLCIKLYSSAWFVHLFAIIESLAILLPVKRMVLRLSRSVQPPVDYPALDNGTLIYGLEPSEPVIFQENGLTFEAYSKIGQKTGFFLDQRENRKQVGEQSRDCAVLNVFSYTGGFSLYAARGGARVVTSLDISKNALLGAERNFRMNQHLPTVAATEHRIIQGDAFQVLAQLNAANQQFDVVIIDPPSFAKQQSEIQNALKSYKHLTQLGLSVLRPTGLIVLASCSSRVRTDSFSETVHHAAYEIGRPLQVYQQTSHPLDHPVRFPEGAYLKCLFARA